MDPSWLTIARNELVSGVYEIPGPESNKRIEEYLATCRWVETDDRVPWCSAFVGWCCEQAGVPSTNRANARSWLNWGTAVSLPPVGAVTILKRGREPQPNRHITKAPGHVGFYLGHATPQHAILLGGNQSNAVRASIYPLSKVLGYRWPGENMT